MRKPELSELYRHHLERLAWIDEMVATHGLRHRALWVADLEAAHKAGQPAVAMDIEGLDFLRVKFEKPPGRRTSAASGMLSFVLYAE